MVERCNDWHGQYLRNRIVKLRKGSKAQDELVAALNNYCGGDQPAEQDGE